MLGEICNSWHGRVLMGRTEAPWAVEPAGAKAQKQQYAGPRKVINWSDASRGLSLSLPFSHHLPGKTCLSEYRSPVALVLVGVPISHAGGHRLGGVVVDGTMSLTHSSGWPFLSFPVSSGFLSPPALKTYSENVLPSKLSRVI